MYLILQKSQGRKVLQPILQQLEPARWAHLLLLQALKRKTVKIIHQVERGKTGITSGPGRRLPPETENGHDEWDHEPYGGTQEAAADLPAQRHEQSHPSSPWVYRQPPEGDPDPAHALLHVSTSHVLHPARPACSSLRLGCGTCLCPGHPGRPERASPPVSIVDTRLPQVQNCSFVLWYILIAGKIAARRCPGVKVVSLRLSQACWQWTQGSFSKTPTGADLNCFHIYMI